MKQVENFDPRDKMFHFVLDQYSCYRRKTGICSLDDITIQELFNCESYIGECNESSIKYCRGMAKLFLDNKFSTPADIYLNKKCGHYCCSGGQHRVCVVAHLLKKGAQVKLNANFTEQEGSCRYCLIQEDYAQKEKRLSILVRILKIGEYKTIRNARQNYEEHECMYIL
ncbi:hypothetical protein WY13_01037 [Clostridium ljungdahlii]|uniref:Uncharacterized protein n=2 Tax=Clostridium ljungdahlii TaxID=1538 RepID=A0A166RED4_9CLOT|nr:hypothetical protein WY13_01037 [Clostridium ljungdahlii]